MKKQIASLFVVVLAVALPGWGVSHTRSLGAQHQFHVAPKKGVSPAYDRIHARLANAEAARQERLAKMGILPAPNGKQAAAGKLKPHRNSPTGGSTVGFVAATQIPAGGYMSTSPVLTGDFNGDGKTDLVTVVSTSSSVISIAASLGNGDGTFQAPQITAIPANSSDAFVVGDVNGDGKDDVVIVHLASGTSPSSLDIFLGNGDGTFTFNNNTVVTGNDLAGGLLYDINGDGKLDAVVVDSAGAGSSTGVGNVWILLGNGDGTFGAPTQVVLSNHAGSNVVFGDFNGDGLLDFADNDFSSGELSVYLGAGGMQFNAIAQYPTSDGAYDGCGNAVGDMTGDGKPEIVSSNCVDNNVTVYLNNGDGTFQTGVYFAAATSGPGGSTPYVAPGAVAIGDVNGDGLGDVIVTNTESGDMTVLLSNGDGTLNVPSVGYATGGGPVTPAVVTDLNGDGLPDIVVTDDYYSFSYMKGYGDGTFRAAADYYSPVPDGGQAAGYDIASGDFNGDGFADVVIGNYCCDSTAGITVFLSNGDGTFRPSVNYGSGGALAYVAVGDFNKDGAPDIAAVDTSAGTVQIFSGVPSSGVGNGTFTAGTPIATGDTGAEKIVVADFNGDGWPDLAVASSEGSNFVVLLNDTTGNLVPQTPVTTAFSANDIVAADVNGDGRIDLLLPEPQSGNLAVFLGNGDGTFQPEQDFFLGNNPIQIAVGDVTGDGKPDVVATDQDFGLGMGIVVAQGNGDGTFAALNATPYPSTIQTPFAGQPYPTYIQMTDLNGDGILDLVYTNNSYGTVGVMFGNGDGTFTAPAEYPSGTFAYGLVLADVNGDGALDVVTTSQSLSQASVLLNTSGSKELPDYAVTPNANTASVNPGQTATIMVTLTPRNFYNGTVTFACSGLPSESQCNFNASSLTPAGNVPMTSTLTITTTAPSTSMMLPMQVPTQSNPWSGNTTLLAAFSMVGMFGIMLAASSKKNRRFAVVLGTLALGAMIVTVGCGGGSSNNIITPPHMDPGTPAGTYTVTVTATGTAGTNGGNTSAHTFTVSLTVQ